MVKKIYQNLTAKPLSRFPKSWGGHKCPTNVSSLPAPHIRFAPHIKDETASVKKKTIDFGVFLTLFVAIFSGRRLKLFGTALGG